MMVFAFTGPNNGDSIHTPNVSAEYTGTVIGTFTSNSPKVKQLFLFGCCPVKSVDIHRYPLVPICLN